VRFKLDQFCKSNTLDIKFDHVKESAFTLIELLIVLAIFGILTSIAIPNVVQMKTRATVAATKENISNLANASQLFAIDTGSFPSSSAYDSKIDLTVLTKKNRYISKIDYLDPFQRPTLSDQIETTFISPFLGNSPENQNHGFVYVNYQNFLSSDIPKYHGIGIYSIGPDRNDSWLSLYPLPANSRDLIRRKMLQVYGDTALSPITVYNPSNGIISEGDFGAFRGEFNGFVPQEL